MADRPNEEIAQLEQIVATLRRRLGALELQRARLGEHTPRCNRQPNDTG